MNFFENLIVSLVLKFYHLFDDEKCVLYYDENDNLYQVEYCPNLLHRYFVIRQDRMIREDGYCKTKKVMDLSYQERALFLNSSNDIQ